MANDHAAPNPAAPSVAPATPASQTRMQTGVPRAEPAAWQVALAIAAACVLVYAGTLDGPFLFDDQQTILDNPTLQPPFSLARALAPPRETPVAARPFPNLSFALDYALHGTQPQGYHGGNLVLHALVAWLAFLLLRETLRGTRAPELLQARAAWFAAASALVFCVHPLAVELVLYASQRTESMVAACYLLALLAIALAASAERAGQVNSARRYWPLAALASLLGAGSKEVFVTAPVVALFFDRAWFAGSFSAALRKRGVLHATLASSWLLIALLQHGDPRPGSVRFLELDYLIAQAKIIPDYFGCALWPAHPALDYGPLLPQSFAASWPFVLGVGASLLACGVLAFTHPRAGFVAVWIFGVLAPSSSLFSIHTEVGAERRFYLPLIAVIALVLWLGERALAFGCARTAVSQHVARALPALLLACAVVALAAASRTHAGDFASVESAWRSAVAARPQNPRAHYNLAETLRRQGDLPGAIAAFEAALARDPNYTDAHMNLAGLLLATGQPQRALSHLAAGTRLRPSDPQAHYNYGIALALSGQLEAAAHELQASLALAPTQTQAHEKLGLVWLSLQRFDAARAEVGWLAQHAPGDPAGAALQRRLDALAARTPAPTPTLTPTPTSLHATPLTKSMFQPTGQWLGADSAYSVDLGDNRVLWLFADTFIDPKADGSRTNGNNFFVRNTCALQTGTDASSAYDPTRASLTFAWGPEKAGVPSSFFHDEDGSKHWLWPLHGARLPSGELLLFRMHVVAVKTGFGFEVRGWDAVAIDDPSQPLSAWRPRVIAPLTAAPDLLLGSSVLISGDYLYAYAVRNSPHDHSVFLARFALAQLRGLPRGALAEPQWFGASGFAPGFGPGTAHAAPLALFADGQVELSVSYLPEQRRFVELQMRGLFLSDPNTQLVLRWAERPEGPWSAPSGFFRPPEAQLPNAADLVAYAGKAHPEQRVAGAPPGGAGSLVVSYVVNDVKHPTPDDALYYPKLVRVDFSGVARP